MVWLPDGEKKFEDTCFHRIHKRDGHMNRGHCIWHRPCLHSIAQQIWFV